jgi:undecaprenyl-diphosphatase
MVTVVGSLVLNAVLKDVFSRPRPELWPHRGQYQWSAYPSGHAIVGVALFFTVARMLCRERGWRWPFAAAAALLSVNLYSRLYLGVHWPTDVLGGLIVGFVWLCVTEYAFARFDVLDVPHDQRSPTRDRRRGAASSSSIEGAGA